MVLLNVSEEVADRVHTYAREHALDDDAALRELLAIAHTVVRTPGVCGGCARVAGTRIPVWTILAWWRQGATDTEILADYPGLRAADLSAVRTWIQDHEAEAEADLVEQDRAA